MSERILLLDDEEKIIDLLSRYLKKRGLAVDAFTDPLLALQALGEETYAVAVADMKMPRMDGATWAAEALARHPALKVIIMTAYGTVEMAVGAMRAGVYDYLLKPFEMEDMYSSVRRALEVSELRRKTSVLERDLDRLKTREPVGESQAMSRVLGAAKDVAATRATVLLTGPSGAGKEVLARYLHHHSAVAQGGFVAVNCAAIPANLMESELFGTRKGGFTDAVDTPGQFQMAQGGTLFLDEVGELPLSLQPKLLRAVEHLEIKPVGADRPVRVDVRLLAATNRDLGEMVAAGLFREDLFYRLNVFHIEIPSLKDRLGDMEVLVRDLLERISHRVGRPPRPVSSAAMAIFRAYAWPGNVRELENVLERALVLGKEDVLGEDLFRYLIPQSAGTAPSGTEDKSITERVEAFEKSEVLNALRQSGGIKKKAAELLQISQRNLTYYLNKHGLGKGEEEG